MNGLFLFLHSPPLQVGFGELGRSESFPNCKSHLTHNEDQTSISSPSKCDASYNNIPIFKLTFLYLYWEWRGTSTCGKRSLTFKNQNIFFMFFAKTCPKIWITWERRMCLCGRIASAATSQVESVASNCAHLHCTRFSTQNKTHPTSTNLSNFSSNSDKSKGRGQNPQSRKKSVRGWGGTPLSVSFFPFGFWEPTVR